MEELFKLPMEDQIVDAINLLEKLLQAYSYDKENLDRDLVLIEFLLRSIDLAQGCFHAYEKDLVHTLGILSRAIFEMMVLSVWVQSDSTRAIKFKGLFFHGTLRWLKGYINHEPLLNQFKDETNRYDPERRVPLAEIAREAGIYKVYVAYYGELSIFAHGYELPFTSTPPEEFPSLDRQSWTDELATKHINYATIFFNVIKRVVSDWLLERKSTDPELIETIIEVI